LRNLAQPGHPAGAFQAEPEQDGFTGAIVGHSRDEYSAVRRARDGILQWLRRMALCSWWPHCRTLESAVRGADNH
jgi:hypothetical protein